MPPRKRPSPPEPSRNSCLRKRSGKRASSTSMLPNLRPPAECHSPIEDQPSPAIEAPPPGRAWNMCQMKERLRAARIVPLDGQAKAPPPAAHHAVGTDGRHRLDDRLDDLVRRMAGAQVTGALFVAQTIVPGLAMTVSGRKVPAFFGISASSTKAKAMATADCMLACEEFTKLVVCGSEAERSIVSSRRAS